MKIIYFVAFYLCIGNICFSQILKKVVNDAKNEAEWKVRLKARQKTSEAIDSILSPKKNNEKKKEDAKTSSPQRQTAAGSTSSQPKADEMNIGEGFIDLSVSATEIFRGGTIVITGRSIRYQSLNVVKLLITGEGVSESQELKLYEDGSFAAGWNAEKAGEFTITVKSSDGKDQQSVKIKVYDIEVMDDLWVKDNIELTHKTYDKLKQEAERVEGNVGAKDKAELATKMKEVKGKVDMLIKLFTDLEVAANKLEGVASGNPLPPALSDNLSQLNEQLVKQRQEMQQLYDVANHQPYDNTICEYLVMLNEALAAFSTVTDVWAKSITAVLKNIAFGKVVPKGVEVVNTNTVKAGPNTEFIGKEGSKIFATALGDAQALESVVGKASIVGDVAQFVTQTLLRSYCGIIKGELSHNYEITYRNESKVTWWQYSYDTKAAITLRYPKSSSGSLIKMKGTIEGNATTFRFMQDVEQMDGFKEQMKNSTKLIPIVLYSPLAVPFATSQADALGFGAIARGVATPSYFNIPVDGEYNTDHQTIKLFINEPIIDFTPAVQYVYAFIGLPMGLPIVTRVNFPINKARPTLNAVISKNNELQVTKDAKNNLLIKGEGERHIGSQSDPIEHNIKFTLTAKKEN